MKIYILINSQDTDGALGTNVAPFTDQAAAQAALRQVWEEALVSWDFDTSEPTTDDHYCECGENTAIIRDGDDVETWRIETHEVSVSVAVEVEGGLVQNVYANADVSVEVYDLDVSDFPDEGEPEAADAKKKELEELIKSPGWECVW